MENTIIGTSSTNSVHTGNIVSIDINDKNTHIIHIPIVKERTLQDVLGNE